MWQKISSESFVVDSSLWSHYFYSKSPERSSVNTANTSNLTVFSAKNISVLTKSNLVSESGSLLPCWSHSEQLLWKCFFTTPEILESTSDCLFKQVNSSRLSAISLVNPVNLKPPAFTSVFPRELS